MKANMMINRTFKLSNKLPAMYVKGIKINNKFIKKSFLIDMIKY